MIDFRFCIAWPWPKEGQSDGDRHYVEIDRPISKNKNFSLQISKWPNFHTIFSIMVDLAWSGEDHAGPRITIQFFKYFFDIAIYDSRHWNWDTGKWYTYEEAVAEAEEWKKEQENA